MPIERSDLCIQDDNALAEGAQGKLGSLNRLVPPSSVRAESSTHAGLAAERFAGEALAQFSWGCGNEVAELSQRCRAGLDGTGSFPLARSTLSEHCAVLKAAGLVVTERQGTVIVYSLNVSVVEEALGALLGLLHVGDDKRPTGEE